MQVGALSWEYVNSRLFGGTVGADMTPPWCFTLLMGGLPFTGERQTACQPSRRAKAER